MVTVTVLPASMVCAFHIGETVSSAIAVGQENLIIGICPWISRICLMFPFNLWS